MGAFIGHLAHEVSALTDERRPIGHKANLVCIGRSGQHKSVPSGTVPGSKPAEDLTSANREDRSEGRTGRTDRGPVLSGVRQEQDHALEAAALLLLHERPQLALEVHRAGDGLDTDVDRTAIQDFVERSQVSWVAADRNFGAP
jgi:hypothetical protein